MFASFGFWGWNSGHSSKKKWQSFSTNQSTLVFLELQTNVTWKIYFFSVCWTCAAVFYWIACWTSWISSLPLKFAFRSVTCCLLFVSFPALHWVNCFFLQNSVSDSIPKILDEYVIEFATIAVQRCSRQVQHFKNAASRASRLHEPSNSINSSTSDLKTSNW